MNLANEQVSALARPLARIIKEFYSKPENERKYQEWLKENEEEENSI